jgi:hypothetical protein
MSAIWRGRPTLERLTWVECSGCRLDGPVAAYAIAIYFMHYNFVRIHQTLRCIPRHGRWRHYQAVGTDGFGRDPGRMGSAAGNCRLKLTTA